LSKRLLFIVNTDCFFVSHRLEIAIEALRRGYEVHVASNETSCRNKILETGCFFHSIKLDRSSLNPFVNLLEIYEFLKILRALKPNIVHLVTLKPVIFGGIAARLTNIPSVVSAISGLGYIFISEGVKSTLLRRVLMFFFKRALHHNNQVTIFQNSDDREIISNGCNLSLNSIRMIRGSGVCLKEFKFSELPKGRVKVVLASRLLIDKGIREFVNASMILKKKSDNIDFVLVGDTDPSNPASVSKDEINVWVSKGLIDWWGWKKNMPKIISSAFVVVLPSYREGMPKVIMEASASGRPVITSNVPGCRDAVINNETGIIIPPKDSIALANAINFLIKNKSIATKMGKKGRAHAEQFFDLKDVVNEHMKIYDYLINKTETLQLPTSEN